MASASEGLAALNEADMAFQHSLSVLTSPDGSHGSTHTHSHTPQFVSWVYHSCFVLSDSAAAVKGCVGKLEVVSSVFKAIKTGPRNSPEELEQASLPVVDASMLRMAPIDHLIHHGAFHRT